MMGWFGEQNRGISFGRPFRKHLGMKANKGRKHGQPKGCPDAGQGLKGTSKLAKNLVSHWPNDFRHMIHVYSCNQPAQPNGLTEPTSTPITSEDPKARTTSVWRSVCRRSPPMPGVQSGPSQQKSDRARDAI